MKIDDRIYMMRTYFEGWCACKGVEPDTETCYEYVVAMYDGIEESNTDVNWDGDFDSFYEFMTENMVKWEW